MIKQGIKQLKKSADILWSQIIKYRDKKCIICGSINRLNSHHIFSRSNNSTRYEIENGICLCSGHHLFLAHQYPEKFRQIIIEKIGKEKYEKLFILSNKNQKCDRYFIEEKIKEMQKYFNLNLRRKKNE